MEEHDAETHPPIAVGEPPSNNGTNGVVGAPSTAAASAPLDPVPTIQRDALIFVPGIVRTWDTAALRDIAADVAASLNRLSRGLDFEVAPASIETATGQNRGDSPSTVTITRAVEGAEGVTPTPVLDLYTLEYESALVESQERLPVMLRAVLVLVAIVFGLHRIGRLLNPIERSKSWMERAQILYLIGILVLYAVFLGVLFISIFQFTREALIAVQQGTSSVTTAPATVTPTVPAAIPTTATTTGTPADGGIIGSATVYAESTWAPLSSFFDSLFGRVVHLISLLGALVWLLLPPRSKLKDFVTNTATDYLSVDYYLRSGNGAGRIHGDLLGLVDALRDDPRYTDRRIYLVTYSFGSVLAINALFPASVRLLPGSPMTAIHTLVTIGCPFDLVRLVRPEYFKKRHGAEGRLPGGWLNVYTPNDILGSNFRGISDISPGHVNATASVEPDSSESDDCQTMHRPDHCSWCNVTGGGMPKPTSRIYVPGSAPQEMSSLSLLSLDGFRAHYRYWSPGHSSEDSCFTTIVDYLYRDDPILRG